MTNFDPVFFTANAVVMASAIVIFAYFLSKRKQKKGKR